VLNPKHSYSQVAVFDLRFAPGGTAGTNITITPNLYTEGFNNPSISTATNMTDAGGAFGSFAMTGTGTVITLTLTGGVRFIAPIATTILIQDVNNSSTSEMYFVGAQMASGGAMAFRVRKRGASANVDWRTVLSTAGDLWDVRVTALMGAS
jgi:hypothetical protein